MYVRVYVRYKRNSKVIGSAPSSREITGNKEHRSRTRLTRTCTIKFTNEKCVYVARNSFSLVYKITKETKRNEDRALNGAELSDEPPGKIDRLTEEGN